MNFTYIMEHFVEWATTPYRLVFGDMFWVALFSGVIAISWIISRDLAVTLGAILITFAIFGSTNAFINSGEFGLFFSIIAVASIAGLILELFIVRGNN